jgi:thiol-disulfide isomerase/thioredoxin
MDELTAPMYVITPGSPALLQCKTTINPMGEAITDCNMGSDATPKGHSITNNILYGLLISVMIVLLVSLIISCINSAGRGKQRDDGELVIFESQTDIQHGKHGPHAHQGPAHQGQAHQGQQAHQGHAHSSATKAIEVNSEERLRELTQKGSKPSVILIHAPWCGHCKNAIPEFHKASVECTMDMNFLLVDGTVFKELTKELKVTEFPFYAIVRNGEVHALNTHDRTAASIIKAVTG